MDDQNAELMHDPIESGIVPARTPSPEVEVSEPYHPSELTASPRSLSPDSHHSSPHGLYPDEVTHFPVGNHSPRGPSPFPVDSPTPEIPDHYLERSPTPESPDETPQLEYDRSLERPSSLPAHDQTPERPTPFIMTDHSPNRHDSYPYGHDEPPPVPQSLPIRTPSPRPTPTRTPTRTPSAAGTNSLPARGARHRENSVPVRGSHGDTTLPARSTSTLVNHEEEGDKLSTKNTVLSYRTDHTTRTTNDPEAQRKTRKLYRSAITHLLCGLYALVLIILGLVFALSSSLTHEERERDSLYLQVFQLYIYTMSLLFLIYLHCCLLRYRKPRASGSLRRVNLVSNNQIDQHDKCSTDYNPDLDLNSTMSKHKRSRSMSRSHSDFEDVLDSLSHAVACVTFDAEGINFYLRLGAIAFGTGSMIHDGFRIASLFIDGEFALDCRGPLYVAVAGAHLIFTFFQTFYIFKNHKIVVNKHKAFVRFGFMHMVATNICTWCIATVTETAEDLRSMPENNSIVSAMEFYEKNGTFNIADRQLECMVAYISSLACIAAPYLYPCTIEYSLISAAVVYKMYKNVGSVAKHSIAAWESGTHMRMDCHKANKGLFLGILVAILTLISVSCFFVFDQKLYNYEAGDLLFFGTELVLLFLSCSVVIVGFARMQKLRYVHNAEAVMLDTILLVVAFFGICFLNSFIAISSISELMPFHLMSLLSLATAAMAFIQSLLQTIFIIDGLRRCARTEQDVHSKPGRALVTFLLLCNLSLWVVNTFEVKKAESFDIHREYYGKTAWIIISHLCVPLLIFFRFHSTVCLSDIWVNAYKLKKKDN